MHHQLHIIRMLVSILTSLIEYNNYMTALLEYIDLDVFSSIIVVLMIGILPTVLMTVLIMYKLKSGSVIAVVTSSVYHRHVMASFTIV